MPKTKKLNLVVAYGDTGYHINDLGADKSPRFELYYEPDKKVVMKTNSPYDCHDWMKKNIWKREYDDVDSKKDKTPIRRSRKKT